MANQSGVARATAGDSRRAAALAFSSLLVFVLGLSQVAESQRRTKKEWAKGVPYTTDWDVAIRGVRESGKLLFIFFGSRERTSVGDRVRDMIRVLASGRDKSLKKVSRDFRRKFIFLTVYPTSRTRPGQHLGPKGPYQFWQNSQPTLTIKKWDGKTLWRSDDGWSDRYSVLDLAKSVTNAIKMNGPIRVPKAIRPLLALMKKAKAALSKKKMREAVRRLNAVIEAGSDASKFGGITPYVSREATKILKRMRKDVRKELRRIAKLAKSDRAAAEKAYHRMLRDYKGVPEIEQQIEAARAALGG